MKSAIDKVAKKRDNFYGNLEDHGGKPNNFNPNGGDSKHDGRCSTSPSYERLSSNRTNLSSRARKRSTDTHKQIKRVCLELDKTATRLSQREKGQSLVQLILGIAKPPANSDLSRELSKLKELLTIFKKVTLQGLTELAQGKTARVLVDIEKKTAYKRIRVENGEVGGTFPISIRHRKEDNQILVTGCRKHNLLQTLEAIFIANEHGGPLFTEIAGFTEDGDIILCQPYIKNLQTIEMYEEDSMDISKELADSIKELNLQIIGDVGSPFAIANINGKYAIFDDLHGENILLDKNKKPVLVDALATRFLTNEEINLIKSVRNLAIEENKPIKKKDKELSKLEMA